MKTNKVIISLAPIQAGESICIKSLAADVKESVIRGAAMCHLHCRDENGNLTPDISFLSACFDAIYRETDVIAQVSTGGVSAMNIVQRCAPLAIKQAQSASLNGGSTNLGEAVYVNSFEDIRYCAKQVYAHGILPEIEVFDIGMIHNILKTKESVSYQSPLLFNLVFGHMGGMQPDMESLYSFRSFVPKDAMWGVTHYGRTNWSFLAAAIAMGASVVRIGFEDSHYLSSNSSAQFNWQLVDKLSALIRAMDFETATPEEARKILKLYQR